jgi:hypothetical protein
VTVELEVRKLQGMSEIEVDDADDGDDWNLVGLPTPLILFEAILCLTPSGEVFLEDSFLDVKGEPGGYRGSHWRRVSETIRL